MSSKTEIMVEELYAALKDQPKHTPKQVEAAKAVIRVLVATFVTDDFEVTNKLVPLNYKQHDPLVGDGRDSIYQFKKLEMERIHKLQKAAGKPVQPALIDFKRILVDGDYVFTQSNVKAYEGDLGSSVMDIFRYVDGQFVEHWDTIQLVPAESKNSNTMF